MDREFDLMIRERINEAIAATMKNHALGVLNLPQETNWKRMQRRLGELLIVLGMRMRDGASPATHSANWSHGRV